MSKDIEKIFENNWESIKYELKTLWPKLTHNDVKQMEGSYDILMGKLKKYYKITKDEIDEALTEIVAAAEGNAELKDQVKKFKEKTENDVYSLTGVIQDCVYQCMQTIKDKAITIEEDIIQYAKDNPIKILGIAAIASYSLSKTLRSSSDQSK